MKSLQCIDFPGYSATFEGEIWSHKRNKFIIGKINRYGYHTVGIRNSNSKRLHKQTHRLIALVYIPNPENKPCVNHKDGNKLNNHIDNLEWCTISENTQHSFNNQLQINKKGKEDECSKWLTQYNKQDDIIAEYGSIREAHRLTNIDRKSISQCCNNKMKTAGGYIWKFKERRC